MYYKIVSGGQIVDVCDGLNFVRWQKKNSLFLACSNEAEAGGIISSDGSTIYLLEGAEQVNDLAYAHYAEIDEDTYNSLREQLIENGTAQHGGRKHRNPRTGRKERGATAHRKPAGAGRYADRVHPGNVGARLCLGV